MSDQNEIYLPDPSKSENTSRVFLLMEFSKEVPSVDAALKFLRNNSAHPLPLTRASAPGRIVRLRASINPEIVFGCLAPLGAGVKDDEEIVAVLKANGISVTIIG